MDWWHNSGASAAMEDRLGRDIDVSLVHTVRTSSVVRSCTELDAHHRHATPSLVRVGSLRALRSLAAKDEVQGLLDETAALIDEHGIVLFAPTLHERRSAPAALLGRPYELGSASSAKLIASTPR